MISYTEIGQFRNTIKSVRERFDYVGRDENNDAIFKHDKPYPTLKFRGTVKLHGTNSAIVAYKGADGNIERYEFQSRERILSLESSDTDNAGFMREMINKNYQTLFDGIEFKESCAIYGEWCGKGIQAKMAISQLDKMFVIFGIRIDMVYRNLENYPQLMVDNHEERIFNILQFQKYYIDIDFNNPQLIQNDLIDMMLEVENQCPVGKYFGVEGIGEGIVWEYFDGDEKYVFKVKGEKHQNSKVKTLVTVDVEAMKNIEAFIEYAVTENRMKQGVDKMIELGKPINETTTGEYLRWVFNDVIKEESDTMVASNIDPKKIGGAISAKAKLFWFNYLNNNL